MSYIMLSDGPPKDPPAELPAPTKEQLTAFYAAFGAAVATWQRVEVFVYLLFAHIIQSAHERPLSAAYHQVMNFSTRLSMLDEAVAARYAGNPETQPTAEAWEQISTRISRKSKSRNKIAHYVLYFDPTMRNKERQMFISVSAVHPDRDNINNSAIHGSELTDMSKAFETLLQEAIAFGHGVDGLGAVVVGCYPRACHTLGNPADKVGFL